MNVINSYPSIFAIGHRLIRDIFVDPVVVFLEAEAVFDEIGGLT